LFCFCLAENTSTAVSSHAPTAATGRPDVLVVEDEYAIASGLRFFFRQRGWSCELSSTLQHALEMLDDNPPRWIVLDLMLTDGDGSELLAEVRRRGLDCRVAVLSGMGAGPSLDRAKSMRPELVFAKPVEFGDMFEQMDRN